PLYGRWFASGGARGKEPPARMRELMETFRQALGAAGEEQMRLAKKVWQIALDEVWVIGTVSQSPVITGVRVVKTGRGNVPERLPWVRGRRCWSLRVGQRVHAAPAGSRRVGFCPRPRALTMLSSGKEPCRRGVLFVILLGCCISVPR